MKSPCSELSKRGTLLFQKSCSAMNISGGPPPCLPAESLPTLNVASWYDAHFATAQVEQWTTAPCSGSFHSMQPVAWEM